MVRKRILRCALEKGSWLYSHRATKLGYDTTLVVGLMESKLRPPNLKIIELKSGSVFDWKQGKLKFHNIG